MSRLFDHYGAEGKGYSQPAPLISASELKLPSNMARKQLPRWPRLSEPEMVRHYTWLSKRNFGIDTGFYPLGSCTMKHNPRVNEVVAQLPGIAISTRINRSTNYKAFSQSITKCRKCLQ